MVEKESPLRLEGDPKPDSIRLDDSDAGRS